jgi:hypothetical protein
VLLASMALIPLSLLDGTVTRREGVLLLLLAVAYTGWMVRAARSSSRSAMAAVDAALETSIAQAAGAPTAGGRWRSALVTCAGLATLLLGGSLFVDGAISLAQAIGISERIIGMTIVALGRSLPVLLTNVTAARRGHSDLAVGNVVGSNIFNSLLCLGAAAMAGNVAAPLSLVGAELVALAIMTGLAATLMRSARTISRMAGAVALTLYPAFLIFTMSTAWTARAMSDGVPCDRRVDRASHQSLGGVLDCERACAEWLFGSIPSSALLRLTAPTTCSPQPPLDPSMITLTRASACRVKRHRLSSFRELTSGDPVRI